MVILVSQAHYLTFLIVGVRIYIRRMTNEEPPISGVDQHESIESNIAQVSDDGTRDKLVGHMD